VKTLVLTKRDPSTQVVQRELVRVTGIDSKEWGEHEQVWESREDVVKELEQLIVEAVKDLDKMEDNWSFDLDLLHSALTGDTRMVSLKQYPQAQDGHQACYQAVVETMSVPITPIQGGPLRGAVYAVDLFPFASHQIAEKLGLYVEDLPGQDGWQRAISRINFQLRFDFDLENGTVVYRAV
jgi:hypothetical protein